VDENCDEWLRLVRVYHAPGSATSAAAATPASAHASSLSDTSPEIPTAPSTSRPASRMSTPPAAGTTRPSDIALSAAKKACCCGWAATRRASVREPRPMPSAPPAGGRNPPAGGHGAERGKEGLLLGLVGAPPGQRPGAQAHAERAPRLADRDLRPHDAGPVLARERLEMAARVEDVDGPRCAPQLTA